MKTDTLNLAAWMQTPLCVTTGSTMLAPPPPPADLTRLAPLPPTSSSPWLLETRAVDVDYRVCLADAAGLHGWDDQTLLRCTVDREGPSVQVCADDRGEPLLRGRRLVLPLSWRRRVGVDSFRRVAVLTHRREPRLVIVAMVEVLDLLVDLTRC